MKESSIVYAFGFGLMGIYLLFLGIRNFFIQPNSPKLDFFSNAYLIWLRKSNREEISNNLINKISQDSNIKFYNYFYMFFGIFGVAVFFLIILENG